MHRLKTSVLLPFFLILCLLTPGSLTATDYPDESEAEKEARMNWWKEARFGMFIHWGVYSVLAGTYKGKPVPGTIGEWIMGHARIPKEEYETYAALWNPLFFDADEWVSAAAEAGMRYIIITSKHHDGFALWDSQVSNWDIMEASPFKRDILKELAEACARHNMRLGFYHSIMDWHHPQAQGPSYPNYTNPKITNPEFPVYVEEYLKPQLRELLTEYGDIAVLWFDGEWIDDYTTEMGKDLYQFVRGLQPDIIVNNRVDKGRKGMEGLDREGDFAGDFGTPEQEIPDTGHPGLDWESCMTMNDTWGWKAADTNWKSDEVLIRNLIDVVSKGGNYLLNVGPTPEGYIPAPSLDRLQAIGAWLKVNGEAIYGAQASPYPKPSWGRYTQKEGVLYAHLFEWPEDGVIYVPHPSSGKPIEKARTLSDGSPLKTDAGSMGVTVFLPESAPDPIATVIRLD